MLLVAAIALGGCAAPQPVAVNESAPMVDTAAGQISGTTDRGVRSFLGIPYAAPPVGALRWRPPEPAAAWDGVRTAADYGQSCMQNQPEPFGPYTPEFLAEAPFSEDCLFLNVWTAEAASHRPVLVWFHGGGFNSGSGAVPIYNGATLAGKDAVVITVNYRLGALGFLAHPDLSRESPDKVSGNYGLLDMIAALEWVRANVVQFGGDPNNVTIAGQSAGAAAVNDLLVSPLAAGLFHRAIAQSGSGMGMSTPPLATAERNGVDLANQVRATGIDALRGISAQQLIDATTTQVDLTAGAQMPQQYVPVADGHVLPTSVAEPTAMTGVDVPLLTGYTADEVMPSGDEITPSSFEAMVRKRYGPSADHLLNLYPHADAVTAGESQSTLARDRYMASLLLWTSARSRHTAQPTFLYLFDHPYPNPEAATYKAFHTSDVPYSLGTLTTPGRDFTDVDRELSERMQDAWLSFMATGDPANSSGLPWQPYQTGANEVMRLDEHPGPQRGVSSDARLQALREFVQNGGQLSLF
jgi:para-nitrobenzyl esterase